MLLRNYSNEQNYRCNIYIGLVKVIYVGLDPLGVGIRGSRLFLVFYNQWEMKFYHTHFMLSAGHEVDVTAWSATKNSGCKFINHGHSILNEIHFWQLDLPICTILPELYVYCLHYSYAFMPIFFGEAVHALSYLPLKEYPADVENLCYQMQNHYCNGVSLWVWWVALCDMPCWRYILCVLCYVVGVKYCQGNGVFKFLWFCKMG